MARIRLTKQDIANARPLPTEEVDVPEWAPPEFDLSANDYFVTVRALTARQRDEFEASLVAGEGKKRHTNMVNIRARLIVMCMVDEAGRRTHTEAEALTLGDSSAAAADRVFSVCQRLAGLSPADVEDLEKKSGGDPSAPSTLNSHSPSDSPTPIISLTDSPADR